MTPAEALAVSKPKRKTPPAKTGIRGCTLRTRRNELGLSIRDVAEAVGLSCTGLWQIEHGSDPLLTTAKKLADFFGTTIEAIWSKP